MQIGDRVVTLTHGAGCITAYDMANNAVPPKVQLVWTGRWCVKLDDATKYPWFKDGIACFYPNELTLETQKPA